MSSNQPANNSNEQSEGNERSEENELQEEIEEIQNNIASVLADIIDREETESHNSEGIHYY